MSPALTPKRRVMSASSGFASASGAAAGSGSSAMPHFGQNPGPRRRTSGCIGQV